MENLLPHKDLVTNIHTNYVKRNGEAYTKLLRITLYEAHRLTPEAAVIRQRELINVVQEFGFDGLESLWLIYQDCIATSNLSVVRIARVDNARLLKKVKRYSAKPAPHLPERVTRWNSLIERGVRGEALRVVIDAFADLPPEVAGHMNHRDLLRLGTVRRGLRAIPLRSNQFGKTALAEIIRQGLNIVSDFYGGGGSSASELCTQLNRESKQTSGLFAEMTQENEDRLRAFCSNRATGTGMSDMGVDALDGFATSMCVSGTPEQTREVRNIAQLMWECSGLGAGGHPLAQGGQATEFTIYLGDD